MTAFILALTLFLQIGAIRLRAAAPEIICEGDSVTVKNAPDNAKLILAFYKDGKLANVKTRTGGGTLTENTETADYDEFKAFLWEMNTVTPLCEVQEMKKSNEIYITVNGTTLTAELEENSSADAFYELLKSGDITIDMSDYGGFEKVGSLGTSLPRNDRSITTEPGDVILYQGNQITIYYDENTWSFTRLAKIKNTSQSQLKTILGDRDVRAVFSIN